MSNLELELNVGGEPVDDELVVGDPAPDQPPMTARELLNSALEDIPEVNVYEADDGLRDDDVGDSPELETEPEAEAEQEAEAEEEAEAEAEAEEDLTEEEREALRAQSQVQQPYEESILDFLARVLPASASVGGSGNPNNLANVALARSIAEAETSMGMSERMGRQGGSAPNAGNAQSPIRGGAAGGGAPSKVAQLAESVVGGGVNLLKGAARGMFGNAQQEADFEEQMMERIVDSSAIESRRVMREGVDELDKKLTRLKQLSGKKDAGSAVEREGLTKSITGLVSNLYTHALNESKYSAMTTGSSEDVSVMVGRALSKDNAIKDVLAKHSETLNEHQELSTNLMGLSGDFQAKLKDITGAVCEFLSRLMGKEKQAEQVRGVSPAMG